MAVTAQGDYTGLLGYSLKRDFLGLGFNYRKIETYNYEVIITHLGNGGDLADNIESQFAAKFAEYSNDVNITSYQVPASVDFKESQVNVGKYLISVEARFAEDTGVNPELTNSPYYKGLSTTLASKSDILNSFTESFSFSKNEGGDREFSHSISFGLRSGDKTVAQNIATSVIGGDYEITGFGVNVFNSGLINYGNASTSQNYYSETYNLSQNTYAFTKKKSLLPIDGTTYSSEIKHSLDMGEDGIVNVTEDINVKGKLNYNQALAGLASTVSNSYSRCLDFFSSFSSTLPSTVDPLKSSEISRKTVYNPAGLNASASLSFTNDPNLKTYFFEDAVLDIQRDIGSIVTMSDSYTYTMTGQIVPNMDAVSLGGKSIVKTIFDKKTESEAKCLKAYMDYGFDNGRNVTLLSRTAQVDTRGRSHSANFKYTDDPDYGQTIPILAGGSVDFNKASVTVDDNEPVESFTEYVIINRPTKTSVLSPNFQSSVGSRNVTINAIVSRPTSNQLTSPSIPTDALKALYDLARRKLLDRFLLTTPILYAYHLSNLNYSYNNKNELSLTAEISYTEKKKRG